jgi:hypothetical protein
VISRCSSIPPVRRGGGMRSLEAYPTPLIAADPDRIGGCVDPGDKPLAVIGVVAAIGAVFPADAGRQFLPSIAYDGHHPPVRGKGDASQRLSAVGRGSCRTGCVPGGGVEQFPGTYDDGIELSPEEGTVVQQVESGAGATRVASKATIAANRADGTRPLDFAPFVQEWRQTFMADNTRMTARAGSSTPFGIKPRSCPPVKVPTIEPTAIVSRNPRFRPTAAKL